MSYRRAALTDREPQRSRLVFLLSLIAIVASLLMPVLTLTAEDAAAQGMPPDCDPGYIEVNGECVLDEGQGGVETPTDVPTEIATDVPTEPSVEPAYVTVDKYDCPTTQDWSMATDSEMMVNGGCVPNQTPVTITVNGEPQPVTSSGQWGPYQDLPSISISEDVPEGYNLPLWFCGTYHSGESPNLSPFGASASVMPNVGPGESLYCLIFNHQPPAEQYGTVILHKYACPEDPTFDDPGMASIEQLQMECQQPLGNVAFDYEQNAMSVQQLITDQSGNAQWDQAPVGQYTIREQLPHGYDYAVVHCSYHEANQGNFVGQSIPVLMDDARSWSGMMEAGYVLDCFVFNIPGDQLVLNKYWCAPDFVAPENATEQDYGQCADMPGAEMSWRVAAKASDQEITSLQPDPATGSAGYGDLEQGQEIAITEVLPPDSGYGEPVAYCNEYQRGGNGQSMGVYGYEPGTGVNWTPREGYFLHCNFYNVPEGDFGVQDVDVYAVIQIEKYWCNEGYMPADDATQSDIMASNECQATGPEAAFALDGPGGPYDGMTLPNSEGNVAQWELTEGGAYTVTETLPAGYQMVAYCHVAPLDVNGNGSPTDPQRMGVMNGNQVQWEAQEGYYWICAVFNLYAGDDGNAITLYKWQCEPGTESGQSLDYYQGGLPDQDTGPCETEHMDVPFTVTDANGPQPMNTVHNTTWDDLVWPDQGEITIQETIQPPYGEPMVWCWYNDGEPQQMATQNGLLTLPAAPEEPWTFSCNWYNIPVDEENDNSITVYKWLCDPGTMYGESMAYYQGQNGDPGPCEQEHLDVPIHLIDAGPASPEKDKLTQANGTQFDNIVLDQNGSFQIWIEEPDGFGEPMVWCWPTDGNPGEPSMASGGTWTVTPGGEPFSWQCNVYDIPEGEYQLELYKYGCDYDVDRTLGLDDLWTNPDCAPQYAVPFTVSFGGNPASAYSTDPNGYINWLGVDSGPWSLTEGTTLGFDTPKVYCGPPQSGEAQEMPLSNWTVTGTLDGATPHLVCVWFNFELPPTNGRITVLKFQCPPGTTATDFGLLSESCTEPHNGIGFNLSGNGVNSSQSTAAGAVDWLDLDNGTYTVTETTVLPGYTAPVVFCATVMQDGVESDPQWMSQPVTERAIQLSIDNPPHWIYCHWYNIPTDYGEITIHKWSCPAGYDLHAYGADPKVDCATPQNGVTFTLTPPAGPVLQTTTGDSINGAVYFGGLNPGAYTVTESVPPGTASVFVLNCTGTDIPKVHQYPLSWGPKLDINVASGDSIVCHWYNVPKLETGWVTVHKYVCSTKTFVDKVYCVTYEKGQAFELFQVTGNVSKGVGITNAGGTYTWKDLAPGAYTVREDKGVPCKMTATNVDGKGNARVVAGEGTTIHVYNCTSTPGKVPPGKVPGKYPNTGVPPEGADAFLPANLPALQGEQPTAPAGTPSPEEEAFYAVDCISGEVPEGTPAPSTPAPDATMPPIEAEPTEAPVTADTTPTPPATPEVSEGECERGAIPQRLVIESIGVDAEFEYLEIVDGIMEQPAGPDLVAWYRDTARLGETNNVVVAGHLNWWNVPEGVFYRLQDLQEGDRIEVTGDDGQVYIYEVRTVSQESNLEEPGLDVIGPTDEPTLTLITCGGEWNADIAEYDERTVVRAVQVDVQPAETGGA